MQVSEKTWKVLENIGTLNLKEKNNKKRRNYLVSQLNYDTIKVFTDTLLGIKMKKYQILINKSVYLGLSILELNE